MAVLYLFWHASGMMLIINTDCLWSKETVSRIVGFQFFRFWIRMPSKLTLNWVKNAIQSSKVKFFKSLKTNLEKSTLMSIWSTQSRPKLHRPVFQIELYRVLFITVKKLFRPNKISPPYRNIGHHWSVTRVVVLIFITINATVFLSTSFYANFGQVQHLHRYGQSNYLFLLHLITSFYPNNRPVCSYFPVAP